MVLHEAGLDEPAGPVELLAVVDREDGGPEVALGRIGAEAAMLVAGLLNGQAAHPPRRVVLPPELIIRETTPALR